jgi:hypothetical protein
VRNFRIALITALAPPILDCDGATFNPAKLTQPLNKSGGPLLMAEGVLEPRNPMIEVFAASCARAITGHTDIAPPRTAINSRRRIEDLGA